MKPENWMKCDISPDDDPAYLWFLSKFEDKLSAHGFYNRILAMLYQTEGHWLTLDDIFVEGFAARWGWEPGSVRLAVAYLLQAKLLRRSACFSEAEGETAETVRFTSDHVLREVEFRERRSRTNAENGRKGGLKSGTSKRSLPDRPPPAEPPPSQSKHITVQDSTIHESTRERVPPLPPAGGPPAHARGEDLTDPVEIELEGHFPQPAGQDWTRKNAFITAGRRPLLKYQRIWLTRGELRKVLETLRGKLPKTHWHQVFMAVDFRLSSQEAEGRDPSGVASALWLTSWALKEVLEQLNLEQRIARQQA
ncbi:MAG: hypothetical protein K2X87_09340 [Gemmataceae bacterium]|nr:hypothetical protein [Gemmataceae bacterium]